MKKSRKVWHGLMMLAVLAGVIALVMLLWNAIIPGLTGWGTLTYGSAAGLLILTRLLLGGFGGRMKHRGHGHHHHGHRFPEHRGPGPQGGIPDLEELHQRFHGMSHAERKAYIRRQMFGFGDPSEKAEPPTERESDAQ